MTVGWATDVATVTVVDDDNSGDNTGEIYKLKSCLGTSDYVDSTNTEVNNWDEGVNGWPHLVKVIESGSTDGGYYDLMYLDANDAFILLHDVGSTNALEVFTTDATMELLYIEANTANDLFDDGETAFTVSASSAGSSTIQLDGDASCEFGASTVSHCLQKGEVIMFGASTCGEGAITGEFYTITRVWTVPAEDDGEVDTYFISTDHAANADFDTYNVYILTTEDQSYGYVSECSNRGICNSEEGQCECFSGYTNDNCDMQSAIAV